MKHFYLENLSKDLVIAVLAFASLAGAAGEQGMGPSRAAQVGIGGLI